MSAQQIAALKEKARFNRPADSNTDSPGEANLCICNRQLQDILCRSCGYIFVGRQRRQCLVHPNEIHLMDAVVCPKCRTSSLIEIKTSLTPVKKESDEVMIELSHLRQRRLSGTPDKENTSANLRNINQTEGPSGLFSASSSSNLPAKSLTTDEDWERELGTSCQVKHPSVHVATSLQPGSMQAPYVSQPVISSSELANKHPSKPPTKRGHTQLCKPSIATCTAEDWQRETSISSSMNVSTTQKSNSNLTDLKICANLTPDTNKVSRKVTFAQQDTSLKGSQSPVKLKQNPLTVRQTSQPKTSKKFVDHEVQTEFVVQVTEDPNFLQPVSKPSIQQKQEPTRCVGYNYQPKKPINAGGETSVLKAAIRRSIMQGYHKELDRMSDMCVADRKF